MAKNNNEPKESTPANEQAPTSPDESTSTEGASSTSTNEAAGTGVSSVESLPDDVRALAEANEAANAVNGDNAGAGAGADVDNEPLPPAPPPIVPVASALIPGVDFTVTGVGGPAVGGGPVVEDIDTPSTERAAGVAPATDPMTTGPGGQIVGSIESIAPPGGPSFAANARTVGGSAPTPTPTGMGATTGLTPNRPPVGGVVQEAINQVNAGNVEINAGTVASIIAATQAAGRVAVIPTQGLNVAKRRGGEYIVMYAIVDANGLPVADPSPEIVADLQAQLEARQRQLQEAGLQ